MCTYVYTQQHMYTVIVISLFIIFNNYYYATAKWNSVTWLVNQSMSFSLTGAIRVWIHSSLLLHGSSPLQRSAPIHYANCTKASMGVHAHLAESRLSLLAKLCVCPHCYGILKSLTYNTLDNKSLAFTEIRSPWKLTSWVRSTRVSIQFPR